MLSGAGLPTADVQPGHPVLLGTYQGGDLIGVCGLETYGAVGLLRSLVVTPLERNRHVGLALVRAVIALAKERKVSRLFLLTETAEAYFLRLGFRRLSREDLPPEIKRSTEFVSTCPVTAIPMETVL
jgi:amino-acid N-acetyltransferase